MVNEKEELLDLNEQIGVKETSIWKATKQLEDDKELIDLEFAKLEQDITDEKDLVTGKPVYSNEQARKNAFKLALKDKKDLQEKLGHIKTERTVIKFDEIELNAMLRKFSVLKRLLVPEQPIKVDVVK